MRDGSGSVLPRVCRVLQDDTHHLVPAHYAGSEDSAVKRLADGQDDFEALLQLERATSDLVQGEAGLLPAITVRELIFDPPYSAIVNAAFIHAHPLGSRFNGPERGAWYAAFSLETACAEAAFHKSLELQEIEWREEEIFVLGDFLADFHAELHDIRKQRRFQNCLNPDSYAASQKLGRELMQAGSAGIVYPSVRHAGGICIACFRPALVYNVRKGSDISIKFADAFTPPKIDKA